jgi:hypothetical protein
VGLGLLLVDAAGGVRPGPVAYLLTPPATAVCAWLRRRPATPSRRLLGLAGWALLGTTAAGLATLVLALSTRVSWPTDPGGFRLLDVAVLAWFVAALTGAFLLAADREGTAALVALALGPVAQVGGVALLLAVVAV